MSFHNILLFYKRSAYSIYFTQANSSLRTKTSPVIRGEMKRFKQQHDDHYATLKTVSRILADHRIPFKEAYRGQRIDFKPYDLIITVGGDGTFLEAARHLTAKQIIIGVNSVPEYSVGRFCVASTRNFKSILKQILEKRCAIQHLQRLRINIEGQEPVDALNDALICHHNPAMLCRYYLKIDGFKEEQRSSGIWIATPAGSTGAIRSAGGKKMSLLEHGIQYKPRELYRGLFKSYRLRGGVLDTNKKIEIISLTRQGRVYLDGAHHDYPLEYGQRVRIGVSPQSIKTIIRL